MDFQRRRHIGEDMSARDETIGTRMKYTYYTFIQYILHTHKP